MSTETHHHRHHHRHRNPLKKYLGIFILAVVIIGTIFLIINKLYGGSNPSAEGENNQSQKPAPSELSIEPVEFDIPQEGGDITIYVSTDADDWYADCSIRGAVLVKDEDRLHVHFPPRKGNDIIGSIGIRVDYEQVCLLYREAVVHQSGITPNP